jgi:CheY-like chemotaxis protein
VLVVDDGEDARETLGVMLARSGASVITTATADAAFEALRGHPFDVLLSDLGMPARNGYDLIRQIRRTQDDRIRGTPAIAVSAYARDENRERAIAAGYHLHMAKPVTPEELVSAVSALIPR